MWGAKRLPQMVVTTSKQQGLPAGPRERLSRIPWDAGHCSGNAHARSANLVLDVPFGGSATMRSSRWAGDVRPASVGEFQLVAITYERVSASRPCTGRLNAERWSYLDDTGECRQLDGSFTGHRAR